MKPFTDEELKIRRVEAFLDNKYVSEDHFLYINGRITAGQYYGLLDIDDGKLTILTDLGGRDVDE